MAKYQLRTVLPENQNGAPQKSLKELFKDFCYSADFVKVNTKSHYLPQVRMKGYMICIYHGFNLNKASLLSEKVTIQATEWIELMNVLQCPISVAAEDLFVDPENPALEKAMNAQEAKRTQIETQLLQQIGQRAKVIIGDSVRTFS